MKTILLKAHFEFLQNVSHFLVPTHLVVVRRPEVPPDEIWTLRRALTRIHKSAQIFNLGRLLIVQVLELLYPLFERLVPIPTACASFSAFRDCRMYSAFVWVKEILRIIFWCSNNLDCRITIALYVLDRSPVPIR